MRRIVGLGVLLATVLMMPRPASAVPIVGRLDLSGNTVTVTSAGAIDWSPAGGPDGTIQVQASSTGYFSATGPYGSMAGFIDHLLDLNTVTFPAGPAGSFVPLPLFETVTGTGLNFTLVNIDQCGGGPQCAAGAGSPFFFQEFGGSTTIILSMHGFVTDTNQPGEQSNWTGTFSADFPGQSAADIIAELDANGFVTAAYSAAKIATNANVPEPATVMSFGLGAALLAAMRRRRNAQATKAQA
jgi:hypothetical protein